MTTWRPDQPPPSEREPRRVAESLDVVARWLGTPPADVLTAVFAHWADLVGEDIAAHAVPKVLRGGVLTVVVDNPAWATQLRFLSATLVDRLGGRTGAPDEIRSIRIQVGDPSGTARRAQRHDPAPDPDPAGDSNHNGPPDPAGHPGDPNRPRPARRRYPPAGRPGRKLAHRPDHRGR